MAALQRYQNMFTIEQLWKSVEKRQKIEVSSFLQLIQFDFCISFHELALFTTTLAFKLS